MKLVCPHCKKRFQISIMQNIESATLEGNIAVCPYCLKDSPIPDGEYSFDENGIATLLSGPEFTPDILIQLQELALAAQRNNYSAEKFKAEAANISLVVSKVTSLLKTNQHGAFLAWLNILLTAIAIVIAVKTQSPVIKKSHVTRERGEKEKTTLVESRLDEQPIIEALSVPGISYEDLVKLSKLIEKAQVKRYTQEKFSNLALRISSNFEALAKVVLPTNPSEFWTMMGVISATVLGWIAIRKKKDKDNSISQRSAVRMSRRHRR